MELAQVSEPRVRGNSCDTCRARKIKCDRASPCSSCRAANNTCRTTRGPPEKRQRVLISPRYEKEITGVNTRLASLEKLLQDVQASLGSHVTASHRLSKTHISDSPLSGPNNFNQTEDNSSFEGESSFAAHSKHAALTFEKAVGKSPYSKPGEDAVASLRQTVRHGLTGPQGFGASFLKAEFSSLPLPPRQLVTTTLLHCRHSMTRFFRDFPFLTVAAFTEMCHKVYLPTEGCSLSDFIIVNTGLCNLFRDLSNDLIIVQGLDHSVVANGISICASNAENVVVDLKLALEPTFDNIVALLLLASTRMDWLTSSLSWRLISHAAVLCQEAGYHRLSNSPACDDFRQKCLVFWYVWAFNIVFSFNLGRGSAMPDHDIKTPRPRCPGDIDAEWGFGFISWLDFVDLQQEIYQQLYSGKAQNEAPEVKTQRARGLAEKLLAMRDVFLTKKNDNKAGSVGAGTDAEESFELLFYSILTLVYRMIPPKRQKHPLQLCEECTAAARTALNIQNRAWEKIKHKNDETWKLFIHWTLLSSPFVPYLVVFSNAITTRDEDDLQLLDRVVISLQAAAQHSPGIAKLHNICNAYYQAGKFYLEEVHPSPKLRPVEEGHRDIQSTIGNMSHSPIDSTDSAFLQGQNWDELLDEWGLGFGAESAREVSSFLDNYFSGGLDS